MGKMIVSACLVGCACRYDGKSMPDPLLKAMFEAGDLLAVCPEVLGGLDTPRNPAEIVSEEPIQLLTNQGLDVTAAYKDGANQAVAVAKAIDANAAILKSKSPSCGSKQIYDGSFQRKVIPGSGVTARAMRAAGIEVMNEEEACERFKRECTRILVLRHAESLFSSDERGRGLTEAGARHAIELAEAFVKRFEIQDVYASPYRRAIDTARPWAKRLGLEIKREEELRERKVAKGLIADFLPYAQRQWLDFDFCLPEGESLREVAERGREALLEIERVHRGRTVLAATHGTWMGAVFHSFDSHFGYSDWESIQMPDLYEMIFYHGVWVETKRVIEE